MVSFFENRCILFCFIEHDLDTSKMFHIAHFHHFICFCKCKFYDLLRFVRKPLGFRPPKYLTFHWKLWNTSTLYHTGNSAGASQAEWAERKALLDFLPGRRFEKIKAEPEEKRRDGTNFTPTQNLKYGSSMRFNLYFSYNLIGAANGKIEESLPKHPTLTKTVDNMGWFIRTSKWIIFSCVCLSKKRASGKTWLLM